MPDEERVAVDEDGSYSENERVLAGGKWSVRDRRTCAILDEHGTLVFWQTGQASVTRKPAKPSVELNRQDGKGQWSTDSC